jgi:hypothetical protein
MAQVTGTVTGLSVAAAAGDEPDGDDDTLTPEEELCRMIITRLRQGFPKAAAAAAVDLVNKLGVDHDIGCSAFL